jgi:hypothetical protein
VECLQLLATRGYAALLPDTPVHPGRVARDIVNAVVPEERVCRSDRYI